MHLMLPKELRKALDVCAPYLVLNEEAKMMEPKEDTPQEIRELYKKTCEEIEKLKWKTTYYS